MCARITRYRFSSHNACRANLWAGRYPIVWRYVKSTEKSVRVGVLPERIPAHDGEIQGVNHRRVDSRSLGKISPFRVTAPGKQILDENRRSLSASVLIFTLPFLWTFSPPCTFSKQGASFVSCVCANFFVHLPSSLFSFASTGCLRIGVSRGEPRPPTQSCAHNPRSRA